MCMEDIRLGRKAQGLEKILAVPQGVNTPLLPNSPNRIAMMISLVSGNVLFLSTSPMTAQNQGSKHATTYQARLEMEIDRHGDLVQKPWYAWTDVDSVVSVYSVLLPEQ